MYSVAGEAAANVAGVPIEQLVRDKIFRPLSFSSMGFTMDAMSKSPNHALPYKAASYEDAVAGRFIELPLDGMAKKSAAAGDMYASVLDLTRWGEVVRKGGVQNGKQVLSKEGIAVTLTAHTIFNPALRDPDVGLSVQYGMGWALGSYKGNNLYEHSKTTYVHHILCIALEIGQGILTILTPVFSFYRAIPKKKIGGRVFGYITDLAVFPNAELVVAVLTNSDVTGLPAYLKFQVADEVLGLRKTHDWLTVDAIATTAALYNIYDGLAKGNFPEKVPNKPPAHELGAYAGEYFHPGFGSIVVRLDEDELHISYEAFKGVLTHYHFESFTTVLSHGTALEMGQLLTFVTGANGKVSGVSIESMSAQAIFTKRQVKSPQATQHPSEYQSRHAHTVVMAQSQLSFRPLHVVQQ